MVKRACAFLRLWIANVSNTPKETRHAVLFTVPSRIFGDACVAGAFSSRYPAPGSGPFECSPRFSDTSRQLCTICKIACALRRRPTFPYRGDALRIIQRTYRARPLICVRSCAHVENIIIPACNKRQWKWWIMPAVIISRRRFNLRDFATRCLTPFVSAVSRTNSTFFTTREISNLWSVSN